MVVGRTSAPKRLRWRSDEERVNAKIAIKKTKPLVRAVRDDFYRACLNGVAPVSADNETHGFSISPSLVRAKIWGLLPSGRSSIRLFLPVARKYNREMSLSSFQATLPATVNFLPLVVII